MFWPPFDRGFARAGKKFKRIPRRKLAADRHNKPKTEEQTLKVQKNLLAMETRKRGSLAKQGIEYSFPGYSGADTNPKPAKKKKTAAVDNTPATPKSTKKKTKKKKADGAETPAAQTPAAAAAKTPKSAKKSGKKVKKTPGKK